MYYDRIFIPTVKEIPKDATIQSHILMIRSGLIKKVSSGIYSLLPLGYKVLKKVEVIIREEMDRIGGNEFYLPVLIPGELWKKSSRWYSMGPELFRLNDRNMQDFVLAPTHEEVFTYLLKDHIKSYRDLPLTVYQIGVKFRDEIRPRFGVMRGKTFIMKDAYSFHREDDKDSLDKTYNDMSYAYRRIFKRCGLETILVTADSGAMGGAKSEEFMVPSHVGEESIIKCPKCGYVANVEKATCKREEFQYRDSGRIELIETPNIKTIEGLKRFLNIGSEHLIKTLVYKTSEEKYVVTLIRGDLGINETKLKNQLEVTDIELASREESMDKLGIPLGFAGPIEVKNVTILADESVKDIKGGITGANRDGYHYKNVNASRDFKPDRYLDLRLVKGGDSCPICSCRLKMFKGIELGHIFKLGNKYTKAFSVSYLDEDGTSKIPIMGCYGIGLERTMAAVIEQNHDEDGIIWPITIAPFKVYILPISYSGRVKEVANQLHDKLSNNGIEVLLDNRNLRSGIKFKDADLIGIPFRVIVGDKRLKDGMVELFQRRTGKMELFRIEEIFDILKIKIEKEIDRYNSNNHK